MILAIDTATQYAGLALYRSDGLLAEEGWFAGRNHTTEVMPRLARMLKTAHLEVNDLTALAVALGPGSFTGLRIGLAVAKGLALPQRLPVIGVPTLEIAAYPFRDQGQPVWAVAQAGRGRLYAACFGPAEEAWRTLVDPFLTSLTDLARQIDSPAWCTGELDEEAAVALRQKSQNKAQIVSPAQRLRRSGFLAEMAAARLEAGDQDDPDALVPIYISSP
ncbi:MAG TPA: tRNA (adenosine(37)-N6)-threonylcarbamoyltransferase complex dimerization subunit type 1 TsaB [Anaerolineae bacterium]|nr:tRNA (adenosine(37)-N6)-threonylcarbamoyltransferase complex dimerization subunit type 1 TsaB [Anaerolineae bacterium]HMR67683.1 tRNA (adenosine(37)-N6)-threonylcarbamoyltransferase complex dimerization subunit type 1 TsaB [Anaerolineae bacterium]